MPTFCFRCTSCSQEFEAGIPLGSRDYPPCPHCRSPSQKLLTPPLGIIFKGSGFYKTDSAPTTKPAKAEETSAPKTKPSKESQSQEPKGLQGPTPPMGPK